MISIIQQFGDDWKDFTHLLTLHGICVLLFLPAQLHIKSNILRRMHNVYLHICNIIFGGWFSQKNKTHSLTTFWKGGILSPPSWVEVSEGKTWLTRVWVIFYKVRCLAELCTHKAHSLSSFFMKNWKKFLIWKFKVSHEPVLSVVLHVLRVWPGQGWMRVEIWKISYYRSIRRKFWFFPFNFILK